MSDDTVKRGEVRAALSQLMQHSGHLAGCAAGADVNATDCECGFAAARRLATTLEIRMGKEDFAGGY